MPYELRVILKVMDDSPSNFARKLIKQHKNGNQKAARTLVQASNNIITIEAANEMLIRKSYEMTGNSIYWLVPNHIWEVEKKKEEY